MRKLCIVHFLELEKYPPAINLIRYLAEHFRNEVKIDVLTTRGPIQFIPSIPGVSIHYLGKWDKKMGKARRFSLYLVFNISVLIRLIKYSPDVILYYETLSAGAPWFYKSLFRSKTELFIHYHEYTSWAQYNTGMFLERWLHKKEMDLYPKANWISHTNSDRLKLFLRDVEKSPPLFAYVVPNYPPGNWKIKQLSESNCRTGFVYVGALSLDTMYLQQIVEFVGARASSCFLDIYSTNLSPEVLEFLEGYSNKNISFKGGVSYDELPGILTKYDIGLVLYKGHIPNYVYNVPNKLFEYHVCGLDVWFPLVMKSSLEFATQGTYPRIVPVDFENLESIDLNQMIDRKALAKKQYDFSCERVLKPLADKLTKGNAA